MVWFLINLILHLLSAYTSLLFDLISFNDSRTTAVHIYVTQLYLFSELHTQLSPGQLSLND